jgi:cytochrome oxidase assembly protein ShyY1
MIAMAIVCILLAQWQISRLDQRQAANRIIEEATAASTTDAFALDRSQEQVDWRSVEATGRYDVDDELLVRQRRLEGKNGFFVVTPLDSSSGRVWVARGWVPPGPDAATLPEVPAAPVGTVTVQGYARPFEDDSGGGDLPAGQIQRISPEELQAASGSGSDAARLWIQAASETPVGGIDVLRLPPPELSEGPHLGYAIQWVMFAGMAIVGGVVLVRRQREYYAQDLAEQSRRPLCADDEET